jgi:sugar-specific transcriptional regulator TrmB
MSTTLRDFIAHREGEIRDQLKALKAELKELQIAKSALDGQEPAPSASKAGGQTIKDMARFVLGSEFAKGGLTSHEILAAIKTEFDRDIDRTSLSPQLSRLKTDGEIALLGEQWFSKKHFDEWTASIFDDSDLIEAGVEPVSEQEEDDSDIPF